MRISTTLLCDSISISPHEGSSAYGPVYGSAYDAACLKEPGFKRITDKNGNEVVSSLSCLFGPACAIKVGDMCVSDGLRYEVVDVRDIRISGLTHHIEADMKSAGEVE